MGNPIRALREDSPREGIYPQRDFFCRIGDSEMKVHHSIPAFVVLVVEAVGALGCEVEPSGSSGSSGDLTSDGGSATRGVKSELIGPGVTEQVENLQAFAKLYGLVRYFHPSDAAAAADWEKIATLGAQEIRKATSQRELQRRLEELFELIAPTIEIYSEDKSAPPPNRVLFQENLPPEDTSGLVSVTWQHMGNGLRTSVPSLYRSRRTGRAGLALSVREEGPQGPLAGASWWAPEPKEFWGQETRFRVLARTAGEEKVWIGVSTGRETTWEAIGSAQSWTEVQVKRSVTRGARAFQLQIALEKEGQAKVKLLALETRAGEGAWKQVDIQSPGTEGERRGWHFSDGIGRSVWVADGRQTSEAFEADAGVEGRSRAIVLRKGSPSQIKLFEKAARPGETANVEIGRDLKAQVPLALWSKGGQTLRPEEARSAGSLAARRGSFSVEEGSPARRLGAVVQAWNATRHFYPYGETVEVQWNRLLREALRGALGDRSWRELQATLQTMLVGLSDGHARVTGGGGNGGRFEQWPVRFDWASGKVVVAKVGEWGWATDEGMCSKSGDVLLGIGGKPTQRLLREAEKTISGSPQHKRQKALAKLWPEDANRPVRVHLQRGEKAVVCRAESRWGRGYGRHLDGPVELRPARIDVLSDSIGYVDLTRATWERVTAGLDSLSETSGLILDLRGYPEGQNGLIAGYLWEGSRPLQGVRTRTPEIAYPRHLSREVSQEKSQRDTIQKKGNIERLIRPREPTFEGPVVVLTGSETISKAESVVGLLKYSDLATVVGEPTAGVTGAINRTPLVGPLVITWTGRKALRPDGRRFHGVGVRPDVRAGRTIEGIREGADEVLQRGLDVLRERLSTEGGKNRQ